MHKITIAMTIVVALVFVLAAPAIADPSFLDGGRVAANEVTSQQPPGARTVQLGQEVTLIYNGSPPINLDPTPPPRPAGPANKSDPPTDGDREHRTATANAAIYRVAGIIPPVSPPPPPPSVGMMGIEDEDVRYVATLRYKWDFCNLDTGATAPQDITTSRTLTKAFPSAGKWRVTAVPEIKWDVGWWEWIWHIDASGTMYVEKVWHHEEYKVQWEPDRAEVYIVTVTTDQVGKPITIPSPETEIGVKVTKVDETKDR